MLTLLMLASWHQGSPARWAAEITCFYVVVLPRLLMLKKQTPHYFSSSHLYSILVSLSSLIEILQVEKSLLWFSLTSVIDFVWPKSSACYTLPVQHQWTWMHLSEWKWLLVYCLFNEKSVNQLQALQQYTNQWTSDVDRSIFHHSCSADCAFLTAEIQYVDEGRTGSCIWLLCRWQTSVDLQAVNVLPGVMTWQVCEQQKPGFLRCCHFTE